MGETNDREEKIEQVTRGHNIVADEWAGASNPHLYPNLHPTHKHSQEMSKMLIFPLLNSGITDRRTNGRTKPLI